MDFSRFFFPLLILIFVAVVLLALTWNAEIPFSDLWAADAQKSATARLVFFNLRFPRVAAGILVGASLSLAGAALQATFRNPLAEPYLLGISAGGALGATLAVAIRLPSFAGFEPSAFLAFLGALGASFLVFQLGQTRAEIAVSEGKARLLLVGVALSAFLSALMSLLIAISGRIELTQQATFWLLGGLTRADWPQNAILLFCFLLGGALLLASARDLNALQVGDDDAAALGVEVAQLQKKLLVAASILSAASVAAAGLIGFVGLLAPHMVRLCGMRDARQLLPGAAIFGAILLVSCDTLARSAAAPIEIPVGIVTALLGVPLFLALARRM